MKTPILLTASLTVNLVLAGTVGYLLHRDPAASSPLVVSTPSAPFRPTALIPPSNQPEITPSADIPPPHQLPSAPPVAFQAAPSPILSKSSYPSPAQSRPAGNYETLSPATVEAQEASFGGNESVDPTASGNSFTFRGVRVALAEVYASQGSNGRPMAIDVTPAALSSAAGSPNADAASPADFSATSAANDSVNLQRSSSTVTLEGGAGNRRDDSHDSNGGGSVSNPSPQADAGSAVALAANDAMQSNGFTREEEIFRLKWGWAALDAARSEARREAGRTPAP